MPLIYNQVVYDDCQLAIWEITETFDQMHSKIHFFQVEDEINISSVYYLVSRIIYSKICYKAGKKPDYFDDHHRYAVALPFAGEFGPVRLICLRKR